MCPHGWDRVNSEQGKKVALIDWVNLAMLITNGLKEKKLLK